MKKLMFKVSTLKNGSLIALIQEINKISCRIQLDLENGFVTVENVNDTMIDTVIELIDNYYTLLGVEIDNSAESEALVPINTDTNVVNATKALEPETITKTIEPQSEDDLIIEKVEFENEYVRQLVNKFLKTAYWAMFKMNIPEGEIGKFIWTSIDEISMRYNKKDCIAFDVGDVVECNYGFHLGGEINGNHISAIVCNISNTGMVYVVPITKVQENLTSHSYLTFVTPDDIFYDTRDYEGATALLDKGRYVRAERLYKVIGKTSPKFFKKVLKNLANTFDFTGTNAESENVPNNKKVGDAENALLKAIESALDKLDYSKKVEEQIDSFLTDIGMSTNERFVRLSFVIACDIKKITYENVILELHNMYPNVKEDIIKASLKENFKKWLEQYPELAKNYPKISLMSVLKIFAKRFA